MFNLIYNIIHQAEAGQNNSVSINIFSIAVCKELKGERGGLTG
jgi:hypothetical protein